jgi:hypothetical protein
VIRALHDEQAFVQAASQQTPSTQCPDWQTRHPVVLQSKVGSHARPFGLRGWQAPAASQYVVGLQFASLSQRAHAVLCPLQVSGAQAAAPGADGATSVHSPSRAAPAAIEQALQAPSHASLQQRPSLQKPLEHSLARVQLSPFAPWNENAYAEPCAISGPSSF